MLRLFFFLALLTAWPLYVHATPGHVLAKGVVYQAATYIQHPRFGTHSSYYGCLPEQVVDINIGANSHDDEGMPLFAPEDGTVRIIHHNTNAWGYSLEWRNLAGTERLFLAHLKNIWAVGAVRAGQQIADIGGTGGWKPHLHIESSRCWLELSGSIVVPPVNPYGNGMFFVSSGPADSRSDQPREFFAVEPTEIEPRSRLELGGSGKAVWP
jgi:hypothetical protein